MDYRVRDGIILRNVCDVWLLIAVGEAAEHCLYVRQVNDTLVWYWQRIAKGKSKDEIIDEAESVFDASKTQLESDLNELKSQLHSMGYLVSASDKVSI